MVCKTTEESQCSVANVGIPFKVVFQEALSKWICKFINYISLFLGSFRKFLIFNSNVDVLNLVQ